MKKKLILLLSCLALAGTASAQSYYESDSDIYGLGSSSKSPYDNPQSVTNEISLYIQDGWGVGYQLRKDFNRYIGWNILGISYMSGFNSPEDNGQVNVRAFGFRAYTPSYKALRGYADLNLGYTMMYGRRNDPSHYFGLDFSVGVQLSKHFAIGYNLNFVAPNGGKSHWGRIAFLF